MSTDVYTKIVLTVIAGALVVIAFQAREIVLAGRDVSYAIAACGRHEVQPCIVQIKQQR